MPMHSSHTVVPVQRSSKSGGNNCRFRVSPSNYQIRPLHPRNTIRVRVKGRGRDTLKATWAEEEEGTRESNPSHDTRKRKRRKENNPTPK
ncbi:hypothetical protein BDV33DRAFT_188928 [Aspergillus novoparasiticus]|uniref:Uncharacterized protein n=1 Tax=Aspergillus novoparasiticus TaxID=986946 RepID=A0A5N6F334_9EURO|nr:hypothetical protein BDV33DRAFT_188928 [Aspergillus novoparasiticus]